jgi:hypothetical protein
MEDRCWCGEALRHAYESWRCAACGRACCPACAEAEGGRPMCLGCVGAGAAAARDAA